MCNKDDFLVFGKYFIVNQVLVKAIHNLINCHFIAAIRSFILSNINIKVIKRLVFSEQQRPASAGFTSPGTFGISKNAMDKYDHSILVRRSHITRSQILL